MKLNVSRIIPGDRGKAGSGWLTRLLINRPKGRRRRQNSQVPLARSHVSKANEGPAARDDKKPFRAGSSSPGRFRARVNRSYPEGKRLLLCASTERTTLAALKIFEVSQTKDAERRTKRVSHREGHDGFGRLRENFRRPAMLKTTPLDCEKKQS